MHNLLRREPNKSGRKRSNNFKQRSARDAAGPDSNPCGASSTSAGAFTSDTCPSMLEIKSIDRLLRGKTLSSVG